jgi:hypothetical protein
LRWNLTKQPGVDNSRGGGSRKVQLGLTQLPWNQHQQLRKLKRAPVLALRPLQTKPHEQRGEGTPHHSNCRAMAGAGKRSTATRLGNPRNPRGGGKGAGRARALRGRGNTTLVQPERDARKETQSVLLRLAVRRRLRGHHCCLLCRKWRGRDGLVGFELLGKRAGPSRGSMNRRCQLSNSPSFALIHFRPFLLPETHAQPFLFGKSTTPCQR